jgi:hypothetical protein
VVGERKLERRVDRFGARIGEEHARHPFRGNLDDPLRELERERVSHLERRCEIERRDALGDRVDDLLAAMPCVDAPQARGAVEDLASFRRVVVHAFARASSRGAFLNWRFIENGMKNAGVLEGRGNVGAYVHGSSLLCCDAGAGEHRMQQHVAALPQGLPLSHFRFHCD